MAFNENTKAMIPAILQLRRLGYVYLPLSKAKWDELINIFMEIFPIASALRSQFKRTPYELIINDLNYHYQKIES